MQAKSSQDLDDLWEREKPAKGFQVENLSQDKESDGMSLQAAIGLKQSQSAKVKGEPKKVKRRSSASKKCRGQEEAGKGTETGRAS